MAKSSIASLKVGPRINERSLLGFSRESWTEKSHRYSTSIGLWRWYIYITITMLNIIHCSVFYLKHKFLRLDSVSAFRWNLHSWFLLCWFNKPYWCCCWYPETEIVSNIVDSTWRWRQNPVSEALLFKWKTGRWLMSKIVIVLLIYHSHKYMYIYSIYLLGSMSNVQNYNSSIDICWHHYPLLG
jgi:hypothetical protein